MEKNKYSKEQKMRACEDYLNGRKTADQSRKTHTEWLNWKESTGDKR